MKVSRGSDLPDVLFRRILAVPRVDPQAGDAWDRLTGLDRRWLLCCFPQLKTSVGGWLNMAEEKAKAPGGCQAEKPDSRRNRRRDPGSLGAASRAPCVALLAGGVVFRLTAPSRATLRRSVQPPTEGRYPDASA